jgi:hypothetical protein
MMQGHNDHKELTTITMSSGLVAFSAIKLFCCFTLGEIMEKVVPYNHVPAFAAFVVTFVFGYKAVISKIMFVPVQSK